MLPTAAVRRPAARSIDSSMSVVVVLPFVPVTTSHGAGVRAAEPPGELELAPHRHARAPARRAMTGACGGRPGDTTRTSASSGSVSPSPSRTVAPMTSRIVGALALPLAVGGVDHRDARPEVHELVGGGEARDPDARPRPRARPTSPTTAA